MNFAPTAAMTLVMEYADGRPMNEVGWGRITRDEITALTGLYVMKVETLQRPYYVAARGASPLMRRMLSALTGAEGPAFSLFVGHDTNISDLTGLLDVGVQIDSYAANFPPPGGARLDRT
jgi:4-phytase/acid phosphatase